jgi:hypothetical protein
MHVFCKKQNKEAIIFLYMSSTLNLSKIQEKPSRESLSKAPFNISLHFFPLQLFPSVFTSKPKEVWVPADQVSNAWPVNTVVEASVPDP